MSNIHVLLLVIVFEGAFCSGERML